MIIKAHYNGNITVTNAKNPKNKQLHELNLSDRTKKRVYKLTYSKYRQLAGNSAKMFEAKTNQILFLTFTIKDNITDTANTNKAWSYFLNLMKKRHGLNNYLWVAERQKRGAVHYHCLLDTPFINYSEWKRIFSSTFKKFGIKASKQNSVSASKYRGAIVRNVEMALKYITKYISKSINKELNISFSGRNYAFTNDINVKPLTITYEQYLEVINTCSKEYNFEYCSTYICDLNAVINLFNSIKQRNTALQDVIHWSDLHFNNQMPTFDAYENIEPNYKML